MLEASIVGVLVTEIVPVVVEEVEPGVEVVILVPRLPLADEEEAFGELFVAVLLLSVEEAVGRAFVGEALEMVAVHQGRSMSPKYTPRVEGGISSSMTPSSTSRKFKKAYWYLQSARRSKGPAKPF